MTRGTPAPGDGGYECDMKVGDATYPTANRARVIPAHLQASERARQAAEKAKQPDQRQGACRRP